MKWPTIIVPASGLWLLALFAGRWYLVRGQTDGSADSGCGLPAPVCDINVPAVLAPSDASLPASVASDGPEVLAFRFAPAAMNGNGGGRAEPASSGPTRLPRYLKRQQAVLLDPARLPGREAVAGRTERLEVFPDFTPTVVWQERATHGANNWAWYGCLREDRWSAVTLTHVADQTVIDVHSPKFGVYQLRGREGELGEAREFDAEDLKGDGNCGVEVAAYGDNGLPQEAPLAEEP